MVGEKKREKKRGVADGGFEPLFGKKLTSLRAVTKPLLVYNS